MNFLETYLKYCYNIKLLKKTNSSSWSFPGGLLNQPTDLNNNYLDGIKRKLTQSCAYGTPPGIPNLHPLTCSSKNNFLYHVLIILNDASSQQYHNWQPKGTDKTPPPMPGIIQIDNKQFSHANGFSWVDFVCLFRESKNKNSPTLHPGVGQWLSQNGESLCDHIGVSKDQIRGGTGSPMANWAGSGNPMLNDISMSGEKKICNQFLRGHCTYGNACKFAHTTGNNGMVASSPQPAITPLAQAPTTDARSLSELFLQTYFTSFNTSPVEAAKLYDPNASFSFDGKSCIGTQAIHGQMTSLMQAGVRQLQLNGPTLNAQYAINNTVVVIGISGGLITEQQQSVPISNTFLLSHSGSNWVIASHLMWRLSI